MGYTHYFTPPAKDVFKGLAHDTQRIIAAAKQGEIALADWDGKGEPVVTEDRISLNGAVVDGVDHGYESFTLLPGGAWDFCKTAQRPYDVVVTAILLRLVFLTQDPSLVSSDGNRDDWSRGAALYEAVFGGPVQVWPAL